MGRKLSNLLIKTTISVALFLLVGFFCRETLCFADSSGTASNANQLEAVVINVDNWAVYVPNRVFYFDANMDKRKLGSLERAANRLRNRKALITFYSTEDLNSGKRDILSDIVPAGRNVNMEIAETEKPEPEKPEPEKPARETVKPVDGSQAKVAPKPPEKTHLPNETAPSPSPVSDAQVAAFVEALRLAAPHTGNPNDGLYSDWKIKPGNILRWSKRCTGKQMDPEEFAADPKAARQILTCVMGKVLREQYGVCKDQYVAVCRAAAWWMTGDPNNYDTPPTSSWAMKVLGFYMRAR